MSSSLELSKEGTVAIINPLPACSSVNAVDQAVDAGVAPGANSDLLLPKTTIGFLTTSSGTWPAVPSVITTAIPATTFQTASLSASTPSSHGSKPAKSALVVAVQEQLQDLAAELVSPDPNVKQVQILSDILLAALRRQGEENNDSHQMAGNLAAAAASHYVRIASSEQFTPVQRTPRGSALVKTSFSETPDSFYSVTGTPSNDTSAVDLKAAVVVPTVVTDNVDNAQALQWQARVRRDPALVPTADNDSTQYSYRCRRCLYPYAWRRELERHYDSHRTMEKMSLCHVCGKTYSRADHLNRHALRHELPEFVCQLCGVAFVRASHLDRHWQISHGLSDEKPSKHRIAKPLSLTPVAATVTSVTTPLLSPNARIVHAEEPLAPLGAISPVTSINGVDKEPKLTVEQIQELQAKADALEKAVHLANSTNMPAYLRPPGREPSPAANQSVQTPSMHPSKSPRKRSRLRRLSSHACPTCQRVFTRLDHMRRHQRIHSGERPFKCSLCGKTYSRGDYLREHMLSQHNGTPMRCRICSGVFSTVTGLRIHECRGGRARTWYLQSCFVNSAGEPMAATVQNGGEKEGNSSMGDEDDGEEVEVEDEEMEMDDEQAEISDEDESLVEKSVGGEDIVSVVLDATGAMQAVQIT